MLVIRLFRTGKKNQPFFKIVVTDKRKSVKSANYKEVVGFYNPLTKQKQLNKERILYWLSKGAKPLETVHNLLVKEKIIEGKKIPKHKKPKEKVAAPAPATEKKEAVATTGAPSAESVSASPVVSEPEKKDTAPPTPTSVPQPPL